MREGNAIAATPSKVDSAGTGRSGGMVSNALAVHSVGSFETDIVVDLGCCIDIIAFDASHSPASRQEDE